MKSSKPKKRSMKVLKAAVEKENAAAKVPKPPKKLRPKTWKEVLEGIPVKDPIEESDITAEGKKYPPPQSGQVFQKHWYEFIDSVTSRSNFNQGHLSQLEILCKLHQDVVELDAFIAANGYTFTSYGRYGEQVKPYPQVNQLNRVRGDIKTYTKLLGLALAEKPGLSGGADKPDKDDDGW